MGANASAETSNDAETVDQKPTNEERTEKWALPRTSDVHENTPSSSKYRAAPKNKNLENKCCRCLKDLRFDINARSLPGQKHRVCGPYTSSSCYTALLNDPAGKCPAPGCGFPVHDKSIKQPQFEK